MIRANNEGCTQMSCKDHEGCCLAGRPRGKRNVLSEVPCHRLMCHSLSQCTSGTGGGWGMAGAVGARSGCEVEVLCYKTTHQFTGEAEFPLMLTIRQF